MGGSCRVSAVWVKEGDVIGDAGEKEEDVIATGAGIAGGDTITIYVEAGDGEGDVDSDGGEK